MKKKKFLSNEEGIRLTASVYAELRDNRVFESR